MSIPVAAVFDAENLAAMVEQGMIARKESGDGRVLYDYTQKCQWSGTWNNETRACRGLVVSDDGYLLGRPFAKFHNLAEHESPALPDIPAEPFDVFDKLDGSLIIAYPWNGRIGVNTRGSFDSSQAVAARAWLDEHYPFGLPIPEGQTWLFEWIAPDNRIVVDYGARRELVLLAVIDNATGRDLPLPDERAWAGQRAARFEFDTLEAVAAAERNEAEGYVVRFASGLRVKLKGAEYVRLHRILTGVSARTIWECLANGAGLEKVLDRVPDEFMRWVETTAADLHVRFHEAETVATKAFDELKHLAHDRKAFALEAVKTPHRAVLFAMLDGKPHAHLLWRDLKPPADRPFVEDVDQ